MGKTILFIEDNYDIRENVAELLVFSGYDVITADNGRKALQYLDTHTPDMIICDIVMPEMDGYELFNILKTKAGSNSIPFIFSTAQSQKEDREKAKAMGIEHYLIKPFDETQLLDCIEKLIKDND